jgi:hypothetical protein
MLQYLYNYTTLADGDYRDGQLAGVLTDYFNAVFNTPAPSASQIAAKWGHQVLINPGIAGNHQQGERKVAPAISGNAMDWETTWRPTGCVPPSTDPRYPSSCYLGGYDPIKQEVLQPLCDPLNCDKANSKQDKNEQWAAYVGRLARDSLTSVPILSQAVGVDVRTIMWMYVSNRTDAHGRAGGVSPKSMSDVFGTFPTGSDDSYFVSQSSPVSRGYGGDHQPPYDTTNPHPSRQWGDYPTPNATWKSDVGIATGTNFVNNVFHGVATFITFGQYDGVIRPPTIAAGLNDGHFSPLVSSAQYVSTLSTGLPRKGGIPLQTTLGGTTIVMPTYEAGHTVPMRAPAELRSDVIQWFLSTPHG